MAEEDKYNQGLERRIIIGMIVSTDYLARIRRFWNADYLSSAMAKRIASWCLEYYDKYECAPSVDIEKIYERKARRLNQDIAEEIEEEILPRLSEEYERAEHFNIEYLYDQTIGYFKQRQLELFAAEIQALIDDGRADEADQRAREHKLISIDEVHIGLELGSEEALERVEHAFNLKRKNVVHYPGALGGVWNEQFARECFVGLLAPEKRGKSYWLLEIALRALRQKSNVAFFQAGDMTEDQQLRRICMYLARRSDRERYCSGHYAPVGDCVYNQMDSCERADRNCSFGIFEGMTKGEVLKHQTYEELKEKATTINYHPCDSSACKKRLGAVWLVWYPAVYPLAADTAKEKLQNFFAKYKRRFKLATYVADTLTVNEIKGCLNLWEQQDGFVPDIVVIDYADLMSISGTDIREFRHRQDHIWKNLRGLSQGHHCLVVTATQADAASYKHDRLTLSNFSEDKRKYAHVTAMYGLNQDRHGVEKKVGIMRINELVVREGDFSVDAQVVVLQDLRRGRPYLESYR